MLFRASEGLAKAATMRQLGLCGSDGPEDGRRATAGESE